MSADRIARITLDEATILRRNADIEQEREVAMRDLEADNAFTPLRAAERGQQGPWSLHLAVAGSGLSAAGAVDATRGRDAPEPGRGGAHRVRGRPRQSR